MGDYTIRTIVVLVVVALLITVVGTVVSVNTLHDLGGTYNQLDYLTGAVSVSDRGQTNITITSTTSLTLGNSTMNFGSGRVNASCHFCGIITGYAVGAPNTLFVAYYTNGTNGSGDSFPEPQSYKNCCVSFSSVVAGFLLENTGNVNVSVGYTCAGNCTHSSFISGNRLSGMAGLELSVSENVDYSMPESGATDTDVSCIGRAISGINITNGSSYTSPALFGRAGPGNYTALSSQGHWICGNYTNYFLMPDGTKDALVVNFNITIPNDAIGTGVQSSFTLTFNATSE